VTRSLQTRLLLGLAVGTSVVLVTAGVVLYALIRAELIAEFDATLASEAHALATLVKEVDGSVQTEMAEHGVSKFQPDERPVHYAIWDQDGGPIERSSGLGSTDLTPFGTTPGLPEIREVVLPGRLAGRMTAIHFAPHRDDEGAGHESAGASGVDRETEITLIVARDTIELDHTLRRIGLLLVGVVGGAVGRLLGAAFGDSGAAFGDGGFWGQPSSGHL